MTYNTIGNNIAEWDDSTPLLFTLTDNLTGDSGQVDLSAMRDICDHTFLLHLRDHLIDRRNRVGTRTIINQGKALKSCFDTIRRLELFDHKVAQIDSMFLLVISRFFEEFSRHSPRVLLTLFNDAPHSPLFAKDIQQGDFPRYTGKKGQIGDRQDRILSRALARTTCVEILRISEEKFETGEMEIGHFSFLNLAFAAYCRPESYRKITLADLFYVKKEDAWYVRVTPAKTKASSTHLKKMKIPYRVNSRMALLLKLQRQSVAETYGHLVSADEVPKLALFPSPRLVKGRSSWVSDHANRNYGQCRDTNAFTRAYFAPIRSYFGSELGDRISANALRHTIGTQMAQMGCTAKTIQAVLKHATDDVCQVYVDIFVHGLIDQLSDALQPAFDAHLPVFKRFRSKADPINLGQAIECEDSESNRVELVGECGTELRCEAAPLGCYDCHRFIPCWDADHSINLRDVEQEIDKYERAGAAFKQMVDKGKHIKFKIVLTMNACDHVRHAGTQQRVDT